MSAIDNLRKAFLLHAPRTVFYEEEALSISVKQHNTAWRALEKQVARVKENPELYRDVLIELTKHEDPKIRCLAAVTCLRANIEGDYAMDVLYEVKTTPGIYRLKQLSIGMAIGMYKKGTLK